MSVLYLGIGRSIFVGPHLDQAMHRHATLQITLSLSRPFLFRTSTTEWVKTSAVAIAPGVSHQLREFSGPHATLLAIPEARKNPGKSDGYLQGQQMRLLDDGYIGRFRKFFEGTLRDEPSCARVFAVLEELIDDLTGLKSYTGRIDERLLTVLEKIQECLPEHISLADLASQVYLSGDRFLHLFKEQLGLPLRQYILQQRVHAALEMILRGSPLTHAALETGFTDASHFTRKFIQLTGMRPSVLKQFRGTVRVLTCMSSRCVRPTVVDVDAAHCAACALHRAVTLDEHSFLRT